MLGPREAVVRWQDFKSSALEDVIRSWGLHSHKGIGFAEGDLVPTLLQKRACMTSLLLPV